MPIQTDLEVTDSFITWVEKINQLGTDVKNGVDNAAEGAIVPEFTGATSTTAGTSGTVPAPTEENTVLCSDGTWKESTTIVQQNIASSGSTAGYLAFGYASADKSFTLYDTSVAVSEDQVTFSAPVTVSTIDGNADKAIKLANPVNYDGITFGQVPGESVLHFGTYTGGFTAGANTIAVTINNFSLVTGAVAHIKTDHTIRQCTSLTLNISGTGAYPVTYGGNSSFDFNQAFRMSTYDSDLERVFTVVFTGTSYELITDILDYRNFLDNEIFIIPDTIYNNGANIKAKIAVQTTLYGAKIASYDVNMMYGDSQIVSRHIDASQITGTYADVDFGTIPSGTTGQLIFCLYGTDTYGNVSSPYLKACDISTNAIALPEILTPVNGVSPTSFTITTSAFTMQSGSDTHVSTDWQVSIDPFRKILIAESNGSTDLTSHDVTVSENVWNINAEITDKIYIWVRHNGQNYGSSGWNVKEVEVGKTRYGEVLYDTNGDPAAVIVGSYASGGTEPWNIRGRRVWLAVGCASKRGTSKMYYSSSSIDMVYMSQARMYEDALNDSNTGTSSGTVVSANTTEEQMDNAFVTYTADGIETEALSSDELTTIMLNAMGSTNTGLGSVWCNNVTLADGTHMDLPSIDVLMRIYQARELIDAVDPTLVGEIVYLGLTENWGNGSTNNTCFASNGTTVSNGYIPRANAGISTLAPSRQDPITYCWCVQTSGNTLVGNINSKRGAIPVLVIDA